MMATRTSVSMAASPAQCERAVREGHFSSVPSVDFALAWLYFQRHVFDFPTVVWDIEQAG
ncbi:hypothetical protein ADL12_45815 [Streptomyces regalis]|uniref:Uncharacterized protein n=1 Tax=Streptomyces regalis TaxID=68262 RepID=A0A101J6J5_9ACTN|nr:hypothetical protein ADL12_45815 [Streptomyces regalis]